MGYLIPYTHHATFHVQPGAEECREALEAQGLLVYIAPDDTGWLLDGEHDVDSDELQAAVATVGLIVARHGGQYTGGEVSAVDDEDVMPDLAAFNAISAAVRRAQPGNKAAPHAA